MKENQNDIQMKKAKVVDINNHVLNHLPVTNKLLSNYLHQGTFLFVIEKQSMRIFCHKRSAWKYYCPGSFSTCFTGIVLESETYLSSGKRKLYQETGLDLELNFLTSLYYEGKNNKVWAQIFYAFYDGQIVNFKYNPEEIEEIELMSYREIVIREQNGEAFTPESMQALHLLNKRVLRQ